MLAKVFCLAFRIITKTSILSWQSCRKLTALPDLISKIRLRMVRIVSLLSGHTAMYSCVSSAYLWKLIPWCHASWCHPPRGSVYRLKRFKSKIDLLGTPHSISCVLEEHVSIPTKKLWSVRSDLNQLKTIPRRPTRQQNHLIKFGDLLYQKQHWDPVTPGVWGNVNLHYTWYHLGRLVLMWINWDGIQKREARHWKSYFFLALQFPKYGTIVL